jgi:cell division septation protein DedD
MSEDRAKYEVETTKPMTLTIVNPEKVQQMDVVYREFAMAMANDDNPFTNTFLTAQAIQTLEEAITPAMMKCIMRLQNSQLGFKTDNKSGYPEVVVKRCVIAAALRGVTPVGNQFNIISGNAYITKEGFGFLVKKIHGLTDFKISFSIPEMEKSGAVVHFKSVWQMNGLKDSMEGDIPIRINSGMGADAVLGKAERKAKCRIYNRITGSELTDGDAGDDVDMARNVTAEVESLYQPAPDARAEQLRMALQAAKDAGVPDEFIDAEMTSTEVYEMVKAFKESEKDVAEPAAEAATEPVEAETVEDAPKPTPEKTAAKVAKKEAVTTTLERVASKMDQAKLAEQILAMFEEGSAVSRVAYLKASGLTEKTDLNTADMGKLRRLFVMMMAEKQHAESQKPAGNDLDFA